MPDDDGLFELAQTDGSEYDLRVEPGRRLVRFPKFLHADVQRAHPSCFVDIPLKRARLEYGSFAVVLECDEPDGLPVSETVSRFYEWLNRTPHPANRHADFCFSVPEGLRVYWWQP